MCPHFGKDCSSKITLNKHIWILKLHVFQTQFFVFHFSENMPPVNPKPGQRWLIIQKVWENKFPLYRSWTKDFTRVDQQNEWEKILDFCHGIGVMYDKIDKIKGMVRNLFLKARDKKNKSKGTGMGTDKGGFLSNPQEKELFSLDLNINVSSVVEF